MAFFKSLINREDMEEAESFSSAQQMSEKDLENLYKKLYMKIGRDFLQKNDFIRIIEELLQTLDVDEEISLYSNEEAVDLAFEYKEILDSGSKNTVKYKDLIDLSE